MGELEAAMRFRLLHTPRRRLPELGGNRVTLTYLWYKSAGYPFNPNSEAVKTIVLWCGLARDNTMLIENLFM